MIIIEEKADRAPCKSHLLLWHR